MKRIVPIGLSLLLMTLTACSGGSSISVNTNTGPLNLTGTWTVTTASTQGHGTFSGTATMTQTGQGLGANGTTTLAAPIGQIALTQNGTALSGTATDSVHSNYSTTYNFTGTYSNGALVLTGSTPCATSQVATMSLTGSATSSSVQGNYTITRGASCYYTNDAGTFTATKM